MTLVAVCAPPVLIAVDFSVISVLAPQIRAGLRLSARELGWLISGYSLGYGTLLLPAGRCADILGARRLLLAGLAVFAVGAGGVATATGPGTAIAARVAQGAGAALMLPATLSLLTTAEDRRAGRRSAAAYGLAVGLGFALGSLAAGALATVASWRLGMALEAPVCLAAAAAARRIAVPATVASARPVRLPALLGVGALVAGGALGGDAGGPAGAVAAAAAAGALLAFAARVGRALTGSPRHVALACAAGAALTGTAVAATLLLTLLLQDGRGQSPLQAGGVLACFGAASFPGAVAARRLAGAGGPGRLLAAGLAVQGVALVAAAAFAHGALLALAACIAGFGFGHVLGNAATAAAASAGLPLGAHGVLGGTLGAAQRLGATLGALLAARAGTDAAGLAASGLCALAGAAVAWIGLRRLPWPGR